MEHRFGRRHHVQLTTRIFLDQSNPLVALTRNISRHGLNLPLTHPELEPNRMVEVMLSDFDDEHCWQTRALVIHASDREGTGLILAENLPQNFYADVAGSRRGEEQMTPGRRMQG
ncbi:hypothetical protein [Thiohalobacter thiocyanaticus]|uniref:PilZ domain-containing protein n=1 Tax=Thiohalobacter thiocyanaticus TaxID=585455 RepID=A0A426QKR5_9GAMM|nr:hypothetical protein [Thiohalobacter thiocyanaticus]RRQ22349.1 hypothetical protein D6C00_10570 [Thiohalobacter thiocyanaticus]